MESSGPYKPFADLDERAEEAARIYDLVEVERECLGRAIARIDRRAWSALIERHRRALADFDRYGQYKYCDLAFWLADKVRVARDAGLFDGPPRAVLDVGMGPGHFAAIASELGHTVLGTDIEVPLYDEIASVLKVDRRIIPVRRNRPYPDLGRRFELVTIIWQTFDVVRKDGGRRYWSLPEWLFFLTDLVDRHLEPGGGIYIQLNEQALPDGRRYNPDLLDWAAAHGGLTGRIDGEIRFEGLRPGCFAGGGLDRR